VNDDILNLIQNLVSVDELRQLETKVFTVRHPPSKTTTRTHEGKLLGVYQLVNKIKIKERIK